MLAAQLRELERDGLVLHAVSVEKPPRVEYELSNAAYGLLPAFRELLNWSRLYGPDSGPSTLGAIAGEVNVDAN